MAAHFDRLRRAMAGIGVSLLLAGTAHAEEPGFATDTPEATVESLHRGLVELSLGEPNADLGQRYRALEPLITATHDLPYIAEFALRRQWPDLSTVDRQRFVAAFERLSVMTYASRFTRLSAETFKFGGSRGLESGRAEITTALARPDAEDLPLEYLLRERDDGWRIINIIADGVSDLALKRAEYQRVLSTGSIDDLIRYVDEQTSRLE